MSKTVSNQAIPTDSFSESHTFSSSLSKGGTKGMSQLETAEKGMIKGLRHAEKQMSQGFGGLFGGLFQPSSSQAPQDDARKIQMKQMKAQLDAQAKQIRTLKQNQAKA